MAGDDWNTLEKKVDELIELCAVLSRENRALRAQQQRHQHVRRSSWRYRQVCTRLSGRTDSVPNYTDLDRQSTQAHRANLKIYSRIW